MKTPICPLAKPEFKPLEQLTAEEARNSVKAFGDLPYSPADAELAAFLSDEISKHAALGFGEVQVNREIPERMADTLRARGFRVLTKHIAPSDMLIETAVKYLHSAYQFGLYPQVRSTIQWDLSLDEDVLKDGEFSSREEGYNFAFAKAEKFKEEKRIEDEEREKKLSESLKRSDEIYANERLARNTSSGCFSMILAGGLIIAAYNWFF